MCNGLGKFYQQNKTKNNTHLINDQNYVFGYRGPKKESLSIRWYNVGPTLLLSLRQNKNHSNFTKMLCAISNGCLAENSLTLIISPAFECLLQNETFLDVIIP